MCKELSLISAYCEQAEGTASYLNEARSVQWLTVCMALIQHSRTIPQPDAKSPRENFAEFLLVYDDSVDQECLLHYILACVSHAMASNCIRSHFTIDWCYIGCRDRCLQILRRVPKYPNCMPSKGCCSSEHLWQMMTPCTKAGFCTGG